MNAYDDGWNRKAKEVKLYRGRILSFRFIEKPDRWVWTAGEEREEISPDTCFLAHDTLMAWEYLKKGEPLRRIFAEDGRFPVRSELGDTDKTLWGKTRDSKPKDPWTITEVVYLTGELSGLKYTAAFRYGERRIVDALCDTIAQRRIEHPQAIPVVKLSKKVFKEAFEAALEIVGWYDDGSGSSQSASATPAPKKEREFGADDDMNDEIPL
jgi:hypothetical protein